MEEQRLEDQLTGQQVQEQQFKIEVAGKAFNQLEQLVKQLLATLSAARMDYSVSESPLPKQVGEYPVSARLFDQASQHAKDIYHIIIGTRSLYTGSRHPWLQESEGTRLSHDIYELIRDADPIPDSHYPICPEQDRRKELNRLRIINAVYGEVFRKLSTPVAAIYAITPSIKKKERGGLYIPDCDTYTQLSTSASHLKNELKTCRMTLLQGVRHTNTANLADTVNTVSKIAAFSYARQEIQLCIDAIPPDIEVEGDQDAFRKALLNILISKLHTLRETENPEVCMGFGQYGENAVLYVTDNGPSIPHEQADMIFTIAEERAPIDDRVGDIYEARRDIRETGGELSVENLEKRGVRMRMELRTTPPPRPPDDTPLPSTEYSL